MNWSNLAVTAAAALLLAAVPADAEIVSASDTHYVLRLEARSSMSTDALWERVVDPAVWWHPDHTYSGDAGNLSLDVEAGGLWREDWDGGSVAHGRVLGVQHGKLLRLDAPFGPLATVGAYTTWTITIVPDGDGAKVVFDEIAHAPATAKLGELAGAVDSVKRTAIERLAGGA